MRTVKEILASHSRSVTVEANQINSDLVKSGLSWAEVGQELEETRNSAASKKEVLKEHAAARKMPAGVEKPIKRCKCGGILKFFSVPERTKEHDEGMRSKKECCGSCGYKPCGFVEYSKQTLEEILKIDND